MKKKFKLGFIGAGFMASSIINGVVKAKVVDPREIIVSDINAHMLDRIATSGVSATQDSVEVCNFADFVVIAVKPQSFSEVAKTIKGCKCKKYISIMAGVKKQKINDYLGDVKVARCMPNTPCSIGFGAVGLDLSDYESEDCCFIKSLFDSFASTVVVEEDLLNAVTGVSGSGPAYFYKFAKAVIDAGVKNGLKYDDAKLLAINTMIGAGQMILNNPEKDIDDLINSVCSKGGTTIEAVNVFNNENLSKIVDKAIDACIKRATELENL